MPASADLRAGGAWLRVLRRYLAFTVIAHLGWEVLHLSLYTHWQGDSAASTAAFLARCTVGDYLIALSALVLALLIINDSDWPYGSYLRGSVLTVLFGLGYTVFSEWLNVRVLETWAYADAMPVVPGIGTGLSPLAQWLVIPVGALWYAQRFEVAA